MMLRRTSVNFSLILLSTALHLSESLKVDLIASSWCHLSSDAFHCIQILLRIKLPLKTKQKKLLQPYTLSSILPLTCVYRLNTTEERNFQTNRWEFQRGPENGSVNPPGNGKQKLDCTTTLLLPSCCCLHCNSLNKRDSISILK